VQFVDVSVFYAWLLQEWARGGQLMSSLIERTRQTFGVADESEIQQAIQTFWEHLLTRHLALGYS
jgi:hypothetical protein